MISWASKKLLNASLAIAFFAALTTVGLFNSTVSADAITGQNNDGLASQTERWLRLRAVTRCFDINDVGKNSYNDVNNGAIFDSGATAIGYLNEDGKVSCDGDGGEAFVRNSFNLIGFANPVAAFCSVQPMAIRSGSDTNKESNFEGCTTGSGNEFDMDNDSGGFNQTAQQVLQFKEGYKKYATAPVPWSPTPEMMYYVYRQSLVEFCGAKLIGKYDPADKNNIDADKRKVVVNDVDLATGDIIRNVYSLTRDQGDKVDDIYVNGDLQNVSNVTCSDMAKKTWDYDEDMSKYVKAYITRTGDVGTGTIDGSNPNGSLEPVCSAGALGWIFCPLTEFISDATKMVAEVLEDRLIYPALTTSDQGKAIRTIWGTVLGIANVGLVIAFLIVIFSQATSIGLSSYGIKKILPRVVAAAILMNLSFFICAIAVDLANILGVSIKAIIENGIKSLPNSGVSEASYSWSSTIVAILGIGLAVITGAIALLMPVLLAAFFAVLTAFLVVAAREVLVTLLIIVAPLAFLAWILPNTEQWFTKWRKLFTTMLLMFPLVMIIFYGSLLLSNVILVSADGGGDGEPDLMVNVIALGVLTVPLFSLPFIMKSAGGVLDRLGVIVNNKNKGIIDRNRQWAKGQSQRTRENNMARLTAADWGKNQSGLKGRVKRGASGGANFVGGYTTRRDGKRASRKQSAEIVQRAAYAEQILDDEKFAKSAAGVGGPVAVRRVQAAAVAQEHEESRKRIASAQQLMSYRERGMEWAPMVAMYERQYAEAAKAGDYETASAALLNIHSKGAGGRASAEKMLTQNTIGGSTQEAAETARKEVERTVYESMQLGARSDIVKGSMNLETGKWELKDVGALATKQIASLDGDILKRALVDDQGQVAMKTVEIKDPQTGQVIRTETKPIISAEQAHEILTTPGLRQEVDDPDLIRLLSQRSPASGPAGGGTPPSSSGGGGTGPLITPPGGGVSGGTTAPPTPTQQQRQQGGNFNNGPGQSPPSPPPAGP